MGTSSSYKGSGGTGSPPDWATSDGSARPIPEESNAALNDWKQAKSAMTRFVNSKEKAKLSHVATRYMKALGGAAGAAAGAAFGRAATIRLGSFLTSIAQQGLDQTIQESGLAGLRGQPLDVVLARLVEFIAPTGGSREEHAARQAISDVLADILAKYAADGDVSGLERLDETGLQQAIEQSIILFIYNRWLDDLGFSLEKGEVREEDAPLLEQDVLEFISDAVKLEFKKTSFAQYNWKSKDIESIVQEIYKTVYSLIGT